MGVAAVISGKYDSKGGAAGSDEVVTVQVELTIFHYKDGAAIDCHIPGELHVAAEDLIATPIIYAG